MTNYYYNKKFIEALNLPKILEENNMINSNLNLAIYYALSSVDSHRNKSGSEVDNSIETEKLLLGDYYSFEYYFLLKEDLTKLEVLTKTLKNCYIKMLVDNSVLTPFVDLVEVLFSFYNKEISQKYKDEILANAVQYYATL